MGILKQQYPNRHLAHLKVDFHLDHRFLCLEIHQVRLVRRRLLPKLLLRLLWL
jgi:hypothetical protein